MNDATERNATRAAQNRSNAATNSHQTVTGRSGEVNAAGRRTADWGHVRRMPPAPQIVGLAEESNALADVVRDVIGSPDGYVPFSVRYGIAYGVLNAGFRRQPVTPETVTNDEEFEALLERDADAGEQTVIRDRNRRTWIIDCNEHGDYWAASFWYEDDETPPPFPLAKAPIALPATVLYGVVSR